MKVVPVYRTGNAEEQKRSHRPEVNDCVFYSLSDAVTQKSSAACILAVT